MSFIGYIKAGVRKFLGLNEIDTRLNALLAKDLHRAAEVSASVDSARFVSEAMVSAKAFGSEIELLDDAISRVPVGSNGVFCEFGVFKGRTINHIARKITRKIYGFDSFEGLPEAWRDGYPKGTFSLKGGALPDFEKNVELIPGWFDESLPRFVKSNVDSIAFLHIDCDLYSSTKTIFDYLGDRLEPGSIIVFDEYFNYPGWRMHEHRAFVEFIERVGREFEYVSYNRNHEQVAVRIL